jgi:hypothetical protein
MTNTRKEGIAEKITIPVKENGKIAYKKSTSTLKIKQLLFQK